MDDDIRRRSACDRCHSQKLRCPKRQGAVVCDRCVKAGASCIYSPFRQKKDPEKLQYADKSALESIDHLIDGHVVEVNESRRICRYSKANKRKRITPPSPEADLDPELRICANSTQTDQEQASDVQGPDWCSNSFSAFPELMNDSTFGDMNFEDQSDYPPLEFDLQSFSNFRDPGDKMSSLLQFRSPPPTINRSLDGSQYGRPISPLPDMNPTRSTLAVALHTPQLQLWGGDVRKHQQSVSQCIRQLSDLSHCLYEHSTTIPPTSIYDPVPDGQSYVDVMNARAQDYANYKVDDTFQLTQELVDIYPSFINIFMRRKIPKAFHSCHASAAFDSDNSDSRSGEPSGPISPSLSDPLALDHSSILLIISCHLRLIEIYGELFKHMKVCIEQKGVVCTTQQASFTAPTLRIGDYVPPATTSVPMQMLLLLHFATSLCDNAVELEACIREPQGGNKSPGSSPNGNNGDGLAALALASAEKVKDHAFGMLNHLSSLRTMMLRDGHMV